MTALAHQAEQAGFDVVIVTGEGHVPAADAHADHDPVKDKWLGEAECQNASAWAGARRRDRGSWAMRRTIFPAQGIGEKTAMKLTPSSARLKNSYAVEDVTPPR